MARKSLVERLEGRTTRTEDGCWLWGGCLTTVGYGQLKLNNSDRERYGVTHLGVHRFAYMLNVGPIPEGMVIDHLCRVRNCVNPAHLEAVTNKENILRGTSPSAVEARAELCVRGHALDYVDPKGRRGCNTCRRAAALAYWRRQKEVAA